MQCIALVGMVKQFLMLYSRLLNCWVELLYFLPAAKRHGQGKVWVGIVLLLQTIVSLVCFSFIFAMCVGILGQHGTVPKLSRSLTCNFYLQIFTCKFYLFFKILKKIKNLNVLFIFSKFFFFIYSYQCIKTLSEIWVWLVESGWKEKVPA